MFVYLFFAWVRCCLVFGSNLLNTTDEHKAAKDEIKDGVVRSKMTWLEAGAEHMLT